MKLKLIIMGKGVPNNRFRTVTYLGVLNSSFLDSGFWLSRIENAETLMKMCGFADTGDVL
jgi:hypothetical protein